MNSPINWKAGPIISVVEHIPIPAYDTFYLDNGIKVIEVNMGSQDILKVEVIFKGSRIFETKKLTAKFCSSLIREGTENMAAANLAEYLDFYGANLSTGSNLDNSYISLSFINKYSGFLLPVLAEICFTPRFSDEEFTKYRDNSIQKLTLDLSKNELLCYRIFTEDLFGKDHSYGYNTELADIEKMTREDVINYYKHAYGSNNCFILVSGKVKNNVRSTLNNLFGQHTHNVNDHGFPEVEQSGPLERKYIKSKNEFQCSLKLGRRLFNRKHEDFTKAFVTNTILGGYFGSRLMSSLREDLGYTYNIYSVFDHLVHSGYFYIDTEMDPKYLSKTEEEIHRQIILLQQEDVKQEELSMVKNYLMGNFLNLVDGPFNVSNFLRSLEIDGIEMMAFLRFVEEIKTISHYDIMHTANKYFQLSDLNEVVVGP